MASEYKGSCFCGAVQLTVTGEPKGMGYCHCTSCRHWSASPINGFSLWSTDSVKVTTGADDIGTYHKNPNSQRKWCKKCGGHLFTDHPPFKMVDVYAAMLPKMPFKPGMHIFYGEKMVSIKDGLPKFQDAPKEMGGSGVTLPE